MRALALFAMAAALAVAALASPAHAAVPRERVAVYCSESGDVCLGIFRKRGAIFLDISTAARYFARYRLCVRGPYGPTVCRSFPMRLAGATYGSSVRWHTNFPRLGPGRYRVTWRVGAPIGPTLSFRVR